MKKLICLQGLPASGKTTKARELLVEYGNAVRMNRDDLRAMLHTGAWDGRQEHITRVIASDVVSTALNDTLAETCIVDDTNLAPSTLQAWQELAAYFEWEFEVMPLDTPLAECLLRDACREHPVGAHVIWGMALQYRLVPQPAKGYVLCDIDGTLADCRHREHYLQQEPKDWQGFFACMSDDTVYQNIRMHVGALAQAGYDVFCVSGRPETYRAETETWLERNDMAWVHTVFMRQAGDHRPDVQVKRDMLTRYWQDTSQIHCVYDDRAEVIEHVWLQAGIPVVLCKEGRILSDANSALEP